MSVNINKGLCSGSGLPAEEIAAEVNRLLAAGRNVVVTAPPGAGKSTLLPLTIMGAGYKICEKACQTVADCQGGLGMRSGGRILMLEPRRLAAMHIAERMAAMCGETVGRTIGYRVRFDSRPGSGIEVVTEGVLTRMLISDPALEGIGTVIFDEFHERSLESDQTLAMVRYAQTVLRPDLRIVIMSATIDTEAVAAALDATAVNCSGKMFPVEISHSRAATDRDNCAVTVAHTVREEWRNGNGSILAFLPGEAEIRKAAELLGGSCGDAVVYPLYGMLPPAEQRKAIAPCREGERKIVLATPIAETSLTIEGVTTVVDSGLYKKLVFNPQSGLSRLETVRISLDMARQRTGRAGRTAPGKCIRLWTPADESRMSDCRRPEILDANLAPMILNIAAWGGAATEDLPWLTTPPKAALVQAAGLLVSLGAVHPDNPASITAHGRELASIPCHPRIANMLLKADSPEAKALAADIAAILDEKDPMASEGTVSICDRVAALRRNSSGRWGRISEISRQYRALARCPEDNSCPDPYEAGILLAAAYPERVAKSQGGGRFLLAGGEPARLDVSDPLSNEEWIAVATMSAREGSDGKVFLAAPVKPEDLALQERDNVGWDPREGCVVARRERRIGKLLVDSRPLDNVSRETIDNVICTAAVSDGLSMFDFNDDVRNLQRRIAKVAEWHPEMELPDVSDNAVLARAGEWVPVFRGKATSAAELKKINMCQVIGSLLSYEQQGFVDALAPERLILPDGNHARIEYRQGASAPVLRVRLQECFGMFETPRVDNGRVPVLMELLSPGFKPVQLTRDLESFWDGTYFEVRKELRRRYPKHYWPDNPREAPPVVLKKKLPQK